MAGVRVLGVVVLVGWIQLTRGTCPAGQYGYMCSYHCHCPPDYCNTTSSCQPPNCSKGWSGPTCQKENIALNKTTTSSDGYTLPSSNAVNGDTSGNDEQRCILSAFNDPNITAAWWRVDLGQETLIHDVIIYFRTNHKVRRNGIQIYIADTATSPTDGTNCYTVTGNRNGTDIPDVLTATCSGEGRYLVLYTTTVNNDGFFNIPIMDFCEVEVNACDDGSYGTNCAQTCSNRNCKGDSSGCNHVTGKCLGGCEAGWAGTDCTQACDDGSYGTNCAQTCSNRNCKGDSSGCNHVTGKCLGGCEAGWAGTDCTQACNDGSYGTNCTQTCSNRNCKGDSSGCNHVTGKCPGGCKAGWAGTDCTQECVHSYGVGCAHQCSSRNCNGTSSCNHVTGQCENGCRPGWKNIDCTVACVQGLEYSAGCGRNCSSRMCEGGTDTCPQDTGLCESGCQSGWKGEDCSTETKNNNPPLIHSISLVIGLVVGIVITLLLGGAVHLYLLKKGSLAWIHGNVKDGDRRDTVDPNMTLGDNYTSISELPRIDGRNTQDSDYAGLDEDTRTDNKHYDAIQNKLYVNT